MVSTRRKNVLSKKQYFFLWTEKRVSTSRDEDLLEKKMVFTSPKMSFY